MKRAYQVAGLAISIALFPSVSVAADWSITDFTAEYWLAADGSMRVEEEISVQFDTPKHGIFRYIPLAYEDASEWFPLNLGLKVESVTDEEGEDLQYESSTANGARVLQIGDPDETITGAAFYSITYTTERSIFFGENDAWIWDINGTGWDAPVGRVEAVVHLPPLLADALTERACFTGIAGSEAEECEIRLGEESGIVSVTTLRPFEPGENLTVSLRFPVGTFPRPTEADRKLHALGQTWIALLFLPLTLFFWWYWRRNGRDPERATRGPVQFDAPAGLTPGEIGVLSDYGAENKDVSATVIDLAIRGYLRIEDLGKKLLGARNYRFTLQNANIDALKSHEQELLRGLFAGLSTNEQVELSDLKNKFHKTNAAVKEKLYKQLIAEGYLPSHPQNVRVAYIMLAALFAVVLIVVSVFLGTMSPWNVIAAFCTGVIAAIFGWNMPRRTEKGRNAWSHIQGLRRYLKEAETLRLETMQGTKSRYLGDTTAPVFTVDLYEKLLPVAMVFGVEASWSKAFADIYTTPPAWYGGTPGNFSAVAFSQSLHQSMGAMNTAFSSSPSSSGGGSSGGGFGGGGGGSW